jgi:hypothetical protein
MVISHKYRFVLLSPWKTASSTCHNRLQVYNESTYSRFFYFNNLFNRVVHQHITFAEFLSLPESKLGYHVGAFVRNPYDRAYSGFIQIQRDIATQPSVTFATEWIKDLVIAQLEENSRRLARCEYDFNQWILSLPEYEIVDVGRNTNMPLHPAHYWTNSADGRRVDFIGKVERFEADFSAFCEKVGIPAPAMVNANVNPQDDLRERSCAGSRYVSRMSPAAIARINEIFKEDFDLFEYELVKPD